MLGGEPHHRDLECQSSFAQGFPQFRRGVQQVPDGPVDLLEHCVRAYRNEPRPLAVPDLHNAHRSQRLQGFADRGPADPEPRHQFALGRQRAPWFHFPALDDLQQPVKHFVRELLPADSLVIGPELTHWYDEYNIWACETCVSR